MNPYDVFGFSDMFGIGNRRENLNTPGNPNQNINRKKKRKKKEVANKSKRINRK